MKTKTKLVILTIAKVVGLFAPLIILISLNFNNWFKYKESSGYTITGGFVIALVVGFLMAIKRLPKLHPIVWALILAIVFTLLEPLMKDIKMISWMSFIGVGLYSLFDEIYKNLKEESGYERQAKQQARAMASAFKVDNLEERGNV